MNETDIRKRQMTVLIIYDITDNRRRRVVNKVLERFGVRIQRSAFECWLDGYQQARLIKYIKFLVDRKEDKVKIYRFGAAAMILEIGQSPTCSREICEII